MITRMRFECITHQRLPCDALLASQCERRQFGADVAYRLEYSSPQSFGRHVRAGVGLTAGEFRARYTFDRALKDFVAQLIEPFQAQLRNFRPT